MQITQTNRTKKNIAFHVDSNVKDSCECSLEIGGVMVSLIFSGNSLEVVFDENLDKDEEKDD